MTIPHVLDTSPTTTESATAFSAPTITDGSTVSIQGAARLTGVPAHTLRWYERVGLVRDVERCSTGRRRFSADHLRWIVMLRALRATGMPVATLQELTERHSLGPAGKPAELVRTHRAQVLTLMSMLHRSLHVLDHVESELRGDDRTLAGAAS